MDFKTPQGPQTPRISVRHQYRVLSERRGEGEGERDGQREREYTDKQTERQTEYFHSALPLDCDLPTPADLFEREF